MPHALAHPSDCVPILIQDTALPAAGDGAQATRRPARMLWWLWSGEDASAWDALWMCSWLWVAAIAIPIALADSCYFPGVAWLLLVAVIGFMVLTCGGGMLYSLHGDWPWVLGAAALLVLVAMAGALPNGAACSYLPMSHG